MNRNSQAFLVLAACAALFLFAIPVVIADADEPNSPDTLQVLSSSRFNVSNYPTQSIPAMAGNITELNLSAQSQTKSWQGYFGNISGTIVLEDALGNTFYDWVDAEPKGEIYASVNDSITWSAIHCFNFTAETEINVTTEEERHYIPDLSADGINETFNMTTNPEFFVGPVTIVQNTCPTAYMYQSSARQETNFVNVLLTDGANLVFTSLLEEKALNIHADKAGYNGADMDFQLLVAEDGHNTTSGAATTTYFFWVELS